MDFSTSLEISGSGLMAQRKRMDIIASSLADIETKRQMAFKALEIGR